MLIYCIVILIVGLGSVMSVDAEHKNLFVSSIEWRAECKKRAYKTVLSLIEPNTTASQLVESGPALDPAHYEDVVEERYLGRLCGYPLCDNPVNKVSQQKFHISVKDKKVYDLSERKQFCSGWCYKASQYFASQLSTIPLWARQNETIPTIELLNKDNTSDKSISQSTESSKPGVHEATASAPSVDSDITSLEHLHITDTTKDSQKPSSETIVKINDTTPHQLGSSDTPNVSLTSPSNVSSDKKPQPAELKANTKVVNDGPKVSVGPKHYGIASMQKLPPRERVMSALQQWKTPDTVRFLAGCLPDYSKNDADDESHSNYLPTVDSHNQLSLRRRIVTQQLMKGLSPILNHVGVTTLQVSGDIVAIVTTLNLQANNISFQPSLWTAVAAILLLLVRRVNKELASVVTLDDMLAFVGKADMSGDDVKKCLAEFDS